MKAAIAGIGWVTGAGRGTGRSGAPFAMPAGKLPHLTRPDVFAAPDQRFGRLDAFSKLGLAAIAFALRDAGLEDASGKRPIGIVAATRLGCLATDLDYLATAIPEHGALASPHLFTYTLPNVFLGEAAIRFGLTGPTFVVTQEDGGGAVALGLALSSIEAGEAEVMVAGCCDLPPDASFLAAMDEPGALFFVLRRAAAAIPAPYGEISLDKGGRALRGRRPVASLAALAAACLAAPRRARTTRSRQSPPEDQP